MKAGSLRQRITLQQQAETRGPDGEYLPAWTAFAVNVPASIVPLSGREFISAGEMQGEVSARITIRWMPGVVDTMRVLHDGTVYTIRAVLPDPTLRRHITLMVGVGVSNG